MSVIALIFLIAVLLLLLEWAKFELRRRTGLKFKLLLAVSWVWSVILQIIMCVVLVIVMCVIYIPCWLWDNRKKIF